MPIVSPTLRRFPLIRIALAILLCALPSRSQAGPFKTPSLQEILDSPTDILAEAAMRQPNGASYEFFEGALPPPRYVNADFRHYPIVLSAPNAGLKSRLISNGSGLNVAGGARSWRDPGVPVIFRVGPDEMRFGEYDFRLDGPRYLDGYLPIVQIRYAHGEAVYEQETFAAVDPVLAGHAVNFVRFSLADGERGNIAVQIDSKSPVQRGQGTLLDEDGNVILWFQGNWHWSRQRLVAILNDKAVASLAVATRPVDPSVPSPLANSGYERHRARSIETWKDLLKTATRVETPEPLVNNAWRSMFLGNYVLINGDRMHYSAGNQYDQLYQAEGTDAVLAMSHWGIGKDARRLIVSQLDFTRKGLEYHQAGHKLQTLAYYYWLTRDAEFIRETRPRWEKEVALIVDGRTEPNGLFPREQYAGDIETPVYSLNSNAKCWRALRDFAEVLGELGEAGEAQKLREVSAEFRRAILAVVEESERRDIDPPFIPIALAGDEHPYELVTSERMGSYWNLMINYVLGTGIFGVGAEREDWIIDYMRQRRSLSMGLMRNWVWARSFWTGHFGINPLYGQRYVITLLQRDEPEQALVSFYGMLAQGVTRDTFIGGEGCSLTPVDEGGRLFYCPPNSASNGFVLWMLRYMLVQDWDLEDDGRPETLRLMFATPKRWMEDGKSIEVERAPTAFGDVSVKMHSRLHSGEIIAEVEAPARTPKQTLLRARVPEGWKITSARVGDKVLPVTAEGTVDVSAFRERFTLRFAVAEE